MALGVLLLPFRRHFGSPEKIRQLFRHHFLLIWFTYAGFALLWLLLNTKGIILSQWDAVRIGAPVLWYTLLPALFLLLYAVFLSTALWTLPAATFIVGWALHIKETITFLRAHMNVKTDVVYSVASVSLSALVLVLCIIVLYVSGPYETGETERPAYGLSGIARKHGG